MQGLRNGAAYLTAVTGLGDKRQGTPIKRGSLRDSIF